MLVCEYCGKEFDPEEARDYFELETGYSYGNLRKTLCGNCAVEAIEDMDDEIYFETCEECGKTFELFSERVEFDSNFPDCNGVTLDDYWAGKVLCCDCALKRAIEDENEHDF